MLTFHIIVLFFNALPAAFAFESMRHIKDCKSRKCSQSIIYTLLIATMIKAIAFCLLQADWIINDYDSGIDDVASLGWMLFDFLNGLTNLMIIVAVRVYLKWN